MIIRQQRSSGDCAAGMAADDCFSVSRVGLQGPCGVSGVWPSRPTVIALFLSRVGLQGPWGGSGV